jgi:hypothetical protein
MAGNLDESRSHMAACEDLVELKGGYYTLGLNGFLSQLIIWFRQELSGMDAIGTSKCAGFKSRGQKAF